MAADERWYFLKDRLQNTASRKCGIDPDKELSYRQQAANFIQDMGQRLPVNQLCINTAIVYMHRFYVFHSFSKFHRNAIATCALFLAAKVEEQPRKLEHVIKVAHMCLQKGPPLDTKSEAYLEQAQQLVMNENIMLQTLGFDVAIDHPHTHIVKCCQLVRASKDLAQTSYFMATNSLHLTTMCLQYKPTVVACVCIHLACKWARWEIPCSSEGKEWFWYVEKAITLELLEELTAEFLLILDKCPSRLKRKILSASSGKDSGFPEKKFKSDSGTASSTAMSNFLLSNMDKNRSPVPVSKPEPVDRSQERASFVQPERPERPDRADHAERQDKVDRPEKPERPEPRERPEKQERLDSRERLEQRERLEKPDRLEPRDRLDKVERPELKERLEKLERPERTERALEKSNPRLDKHERPNRHDRLDKSSHSVENKVSVVLERFDRSSAITERLDKVGRPLSPLLSPPERRGGLPSRTSHVDKFHEHSEMMKPPLPPPPVVNASNHSRIASPVVRPISPLPSEVHRTEGDLRLVDESSHLVPQPMGDTIPVKKHRPESTKPMVKEHRDHRDRKNKEKVSLSSSSSSTPTSSTPSQTVTHRQKSSPIIAPKSTPKTPTTPTTQKTPTMSTLPKIPRLSHSSDKQRQHRKDNSANLNHTTPSSQSETMATQLMPAPTAIPPPPPSSTEGKTREPTTQRPHSAPVAASLHSAEPSKHYSETKHHLNEASKHHSSEATKHHSGDVSKHHSSDTLRHHSSESSKHHSKRVSPYSSDKTLSSASLHTPKCDGEDKVALTIAHVGHEHKKVKVAKPLDVSSLSSGKDPPISTPQTMSQMPQSREKTHHHKEGHSTSRVPDMPSAKSVEQTTHSQQPLPPIQLSVPPTTPQLQPPMPAASHPILPQTQPQVEKAVPPPIQPSAQPVSTKHERHERKERHKHKDRERSREKNHDSSSNAVSEGRGPSTPPEPPPPSASSATPAIPSQRIKLTIAKERLNSSHDGSGNTQHGSSPAKDTPIPKLKISKERLAAATVVTPKSGVENLKLKIKLPKPDKSSHSSSKNSSNAGVAVGIGGGSERSENRKRERQSSPRDPLNSKSNSPRSPKVPRMETRSSRKDDATGVDLNAPPASSLLSLPMPPAEPISPTVQAPPSRPTPVNFDQSSVNARANNGNVSSSGYSNAYPRKGSSGKPHVNYNKNKAPPHRMQNMAQAPYHQIQAGPYPYNQFYPYAHPQQYPPSFYPQAIPGPPMYHNQAPPYPHSQIPPMPPNPGAGHPPLPRDPPPRNPPPPPE